MGVTSDAHRFLNALWGDKPPGLIQIWRLDGRRSSYPRAVVGAASLVDGEIDTYTGVACAGQDHGRYKRAKANQAVAIAGLWLDVDVNGGPDRKSGVAPDQDAAQALAHDLLPPTLVVDSGYGIHAWYLFDEPWHFKNVDDQRAAAVASEQWYALHRAAARERGFSIDHTHDLARLLRPPGTLNGKGDETVPVSFIRADGPRYPRTDLLARAAEAGDVTPQTSLGGAPSDVPVVDVGPARALAQETLEALLENSPEFKATWLHTRSPDWSMSEYDLALCSLAAKALTDQQLADLIALHRRNWNTGEDKAMRLDYVQRTVAKARQQSDRSRSADFFKQRANSVRGVAA